jgi:guanylate kinase
MSKTPSEKGFAIILSSPSGGGKSSLAKALIAMDSKLIMSISATTRKPRPNDIEGINYFFKSRDEFMKMVNNGELLEYSEIYDNLYGIPREFIELQINQANNVLFDIDSQGAYKLKNILSNSVISIFILPPSLQELRNRLVARNQDDQKEIDRRMNLAATEIAEAKNYDYVVINDDFLKTVNQIYNLITKEITKRRGI